MGLVESNINGVILKGVRAAIPEQQPRNSYSSDFKMLILGQNNLWTGTKVAWYSK